MLPKNTIVPKMAWRRLRSITGMLKTISGYITETPPATDKLTAKQTMRPATEDCQIKCVLEYWQDIYTMRAEIYGVWRILKKNSQIIKVP